MHSFLRVRTHLEFIEMNAILRRIIIEVNIYLHLFARTLVYSIPAYINNGCHNAFHLLWTRNPTTQLWCLWHKHVLVLIVYVSIHFCEQRYKQCFLHALIEYNSLSTDCLTFLTNTYTFRTSSFLMSSQTIERANIFLL